MGSMMGKNESKIRIAKQAMLILIKHLRPEDRLGFVVYNTTAQVIFPLTLLSELDLSFVLFLFLILFISLFNHSFIMMFLSRMNIIISL